MKNKIITFLLIIFFSVTLLNLNEVFGVGLISQSWKDDIDGDGKADLIFRTFTAPSDTYVENFAKWSKTQGVANAVDNYYFIVNEGDKDIKYTSIWKDLLSENVGALVENLGVGTFLTTKYIFHKEMMGDYSAPGTEYGYAKSDITVTDELLSLERSLEAATLVKVTPKANNNYNANEHFIHQVERITGKYETVNYGTKLIFYKPNVNKKTQYRTTIINDGKRNIMVTDHVIYADDVEKLITEAKKKGATESCFVSQMLISRSFYKSDVYEAAASLDRFFEQYEKKWYEGSRGVSGNGLGAVANLYDNKLIFPQMSKRTVLVRHINIGNNNHISPKVIEDSTRVEVHKISRI